MDEAAKLGITLFDTAERDGAGESERIVGRWLTSRPGSVTEHVRISTKVGPPWLDGRDRQFDLEYIDRIFSGSLERLAVDAVEILYTHAPDDHPDRPVRLRTGRDRSHARSPGDDPGDRGEVHRLGASNVDADQLRAAIDAAERLGVAGYEVIQNGYNLLDPDGDAEVRRVARVHGIAYTAYSALASGILTGKYRRDTPPPAGSLGELGVLGAMSDAVHDALVRLRTVAEDRGTTTGALALAWLMSRSDVTAITTAPSRTSPDLPLLAAALSLRIGSEEADTWASWFRDAAAESESLT